MSQAGATDNGSDFFQQFRIFHLNPVLFQELGDFIAQRPTDGCNFQTMRQAIVYKDITR